MHAQNRQTGTDSEEFVYAHFFLIITFSTHACYMLREGSPHYALHITSVNASTIGNSARCSTNVSNRAHTPTLLTSLSHTIGAIENPNDGPEEDSAHARLLNTEIDRESGCTGSNSATVSARDTVTNDIVWSILEGMQMMEEANTSQQYILQMMRFGKHLYKRGVSIAGLESSTELMEIVDTVARHMARSIKDDEKSRI